jgi:hypothetical protein
MEFPDDVNFPEFIMYDSNDSDKFFGLGEEVDEGFCDSDDNASNYPQSEAVEEVQAPLSNRHDDDAGYGDIDKILHDQNTVIPSVFSAELNYHDAYLEGPPSPSSLLPAMMFDGHNDILSTTAQSPLSQVSSWCSHPTEPTSTDAHDPPPSDVPHQHNCVPVVGAMSSSSSVLPSWSSIASSSSTSMFLNAGPWVPAVCETATTVLPAVRDQAESCPSSSRPVNGGQLLIPGYSEDAIVNMPYTEFSSLVKRLKLSDKVTTKAKEIRKRGKNRKAAQNCRKNKVRAISSLEGEVQELRQQLSQCSQERDMLLRELQVLKSRFSTLQYQSRICGHKF